MIICKFKNDFNTFAARKNEMIKSYSHIQLATPLGNSGREDCYVHRFG